MNNAPPDPKPAPPTVAPATELKPCPFCGEKPRHFRQENGWQTQCDTFGCVCPISFDPDFVRPGREWNTRPIEDRLRARVAELEAALSEMVDAFGPYASRACERTSPEYKTAKKARAILAARAKEGEKR